MNIDSALYEIALNAADGEEYQPPTELLLAPAGEFKGRDGRLYRNDEPKKVIAHHNREKIKLAFDIDHRICLGGGAAVGWVGKLEERNGELWAVDIEWLSDAHWLLSSKQYRYYSPVYKIEPQTRIIKALGPPALTNNPNLTVNALNHKQSMEESMDKTQEELNAALKNNLELAQQRSQAEAKATGLEHSLNAAKTEQEKLQSELNAYKEKEANAQSEALKTEVNASLDTLIKEGKVLPAQKEFFAGTIRRTEELNKFQELYKDATVVLPVGRGAEGGNDLDMNSLGFDAEELELAKNFGLEPADFAAQK